MLMLCVPAFFACSPLVGQLLETSVQLLLTVDSNSLHITTVELRGFFLIHVLKMNLAPLHWDFGQHMLPRVHAFTAFPIPKGQTKVTPMRTAQLPFIYLQGLKDKKGFISLATPPGTCPLSLVSFA